MSLCQAALRMQRAAHTLYREGRQLYRFCLFFSKSNLRQQKKVSEFPAHPVDTRAHCMRARVQCACWAALIVIDEGSDMKAKRTLALV